MIFYKIFTKSVTILTISVKIHKIHVKQIQECYFLKQQKKPTSKIIQDLGEVLGIGVLGIYGGIRGEYIIN